MSFGYDRLKQTGDKGSRKKTNNKWFETQDSISYWDDFNRQKITYIEIMTDNPDSGYDFPCFTLDYNKSIALNTAYIMTGELDDLKFILGILNSKIGRFLVKLYSLQLQQNQYRMLAQYVANFPIPKESNFRFELIQLVDKLTYNKDITIEKRLNNICYNILKLNLEEIEFINSQ